MAEGNQVANAVAELDDGYLKVMLLLAVRRGQSEEPRRSGFWHALAVLLAEEQDRRRRAAQFVPDAEATAVAVDERPELEAVLDELRIEIRSLEAEMNESFGVLDTPGRIEDDVQAS
jgi:hypothetical protein